MHYPIKNYYTTFICAFQTKQKYELYINEYPLLTIFFKYVTMFKVKNFY